jgi:hypothetical protein
MSWNLTKLDCAVNDIGAVPGKSRHEATALGFVARDNRLAAERSLP